MMHVIQKQVKVKFSQRCQLRINNDYGFEASGLSLEHLDNNQPNLLLCCSGGLVLG